METTVIVAGYNCGCTFAESMEFLISQKTEHKFYVKVIDSSTDAQIAKMTKETCEKYGLEYHFCEDVQGPFEKG